MARSDAHATEQDVPSVECAKDGIAFDQNIPEVMRFSLSMMGTLTQDVSSASSTKDGDRRGERWNVCDRAKTLPGRVHPRQT
ncbi:MAG TPA: hypothetical protein VMW91_02890 [Desulfosporosinus sp.]|nr:hypothetical protein [Desulfosporosinus sp.]